MSTSPNRKGYEQQEHCRLDLAESLRRVLPEVLPEVVAASGGLVREHLRHDVREEMLAAIREAAVPQILQEAVQQRFSELRHAIVDDLRHELRRAVVVGRGTAALAPRMSAAVITEGGEDDHEWMSRHMKVHVAEPPAESTSTNMSTPSPAVVAPNLDDSVGGTGPAGLGGRGGQPSSPAVSVAVPKGGGDSPSRARPALARGKSITTAMWQAAKMVVTAQKASSSSIAPLPPADTAAGAGAEGMSSLGGGTRSGGGDEVGSMEETDASAENSDSFVVQRQVSPESTPDAVLVAVGATSSSTSVASNFGQQLRHARIGGFHVAAAAACWASCIGAMTRLVQSIYFDAFVGFLVLANAVFIGVQTDRIATHRSQDIPAAFQILEHSFVALFSLELGLRLAVHGRRFFRMQGWEWNLFDLIVLMMQFVETVLADVYGRAEGSALPTNFSFIRLLRVLRLVRVIRVIRVLRLISELRTIVTSIMSSLKFLVWTIVLLCFIIYLVAIYFTQLVADCIDGAEEGFLSGSDQDDERGRLQHYFSGLARTVLTLFQCITGGVDWGEVLEPLAGQVSPWTAVVFALYIAFAVLAMLNVVTGVVVESSILNAKADKDFFMINNVRELFKSADGRVSTEMTWDAFMSQLDRPEMRAYFKAMDLDPSEARGLFRLLDMDDSGRIDEEEFLNGCLRLRGPAKALDLALVMKEMRRVSMQLRACMASSRSESTHEQAGQVGNEETLFLVPESDDHQPVPEMEAAGHQQQQQQQPLPQRAPQFGKGPATVTFSSLVDEIDPAGCNETNGASTGETAGPFAAVFSTLPPSPILPGVAASLPPIVEPSPATKRAAQQLMAGRGQGGGCGKGTLLAKQPSAKE
mmetsp:Transcript_76725/g.193713  ORF Transcript_76725/g.193713 Transcript_76725/m.193713 type:complete len:866 (+) Transcript_76725:65-2662(+)|eukprot:CAMPEP_0115397086 /NCGR_PEP_ID=MMETSP0271-20121206/13626_1 /TAXON_ID=71861 /ORGANISM="Scrippsiella trochoidea, Strain CCMP3099" /LENGTH=865 /DNA_ID=CAMNT_0002820829 /DNA_START=1 /DNA_END=2598 /DNA_ORIENTATION=+